MKHLLWKYLWSVLVLGCGALYATEASAHVQVSVAGHEEQHFEKHADWVLEHPMDLVETTVSLKYSILFIEVPHVEPSVRVPDHLHADARFYSDRFLLPPKPLYLFFQVFQV